MKAASIFKRILIKYKDKYRHTVNIAFSPKYLLYTNVFISIGISTSGDMLEQKYEMFMNPKKLLDFQRTYHMGITGMTAGIICHNWYNFLDKLLIGKSLVTVVEKILLDQFICSPLIIISFFATVAVFEKNPFDNFNEEFRDKFWTLYKAEWVVWPPAQFINFYFLPTKYRVFYDNFISLGYDIYTSQVKHMKANRYEDVKIK